MTTETPICDYEGSDYRSRFWTPDRAFEDLAERYALQALLPPHGETLVDVGAGFGRLAGLYVHFDRVVLFDYALSLLKEAQDTWGHDPRFLFVAGDVYRFPIASAACDTLVMVRVLHHLEDVATVFSHVHRALRPQGTFILEFASKRHLKAILRYFLRRQPWNPFSLEPYAFAPLNYDFHPRWVFHRLQEAGFRVERVRAVSHFRISWLKRHVNPRLLARLDAWIQPVGGLYPLSPSVFVRARREGKPEAQPFAFRCPRCGHEPLPVRFEDLTCPQCHARWPYEDGIFNFKAPQ